MTASATFSTRVVGALIAAGVVLAAAFALLSAYGPALRGGRDGGAHALSVAGTGYSGIVTLARATGTAARTTRTLDGGSDAGLLVLTPSPGSDPEQLAELVQARVAQRGAAPVLVVLPKWRTVRLESPASWVQSVGLVPAQAASVPLRNLLKARVLADEGPANGVLSDEEGDWPTLPAPKSLRSIDSAAVQTILANRDGDTVLAWVPARDLYILADPDVLANHALRDPRAARAALDLLRRLGGDRPGGVVFDLTLNGFNAPRSLLRLAFEPPFLTFTLALLAVAALAAAHAATRFGTPRATPRALPFGKRALVDNAAELIRAARREPAMLARYATLMRDLAATATHAPPGLEAGPLGRWLDRRRTGESFDTLADQAAVAQRRNAVLAAAQALHSWQQEVSNDRR